MIFPYYISMFLDCIPRVLLVKSPSAPDLFRVGSIQSPMRVPPCSMDRSHQPSFAGAGPACDEIASGFAPGNAGAAHGIAVGERIDAVRNSGEGFYQVSARRHGDFNGFRRVLGILVGIIAMLPSNYG